MQQYSHNCLSRQYAIHASYSDAGALCANEHDIGAYGRGGIAERDNHFDMMELFYVVE